VGLLQGPKAVVFGGVGLDKGGGVINRAVIDENAFPISEGLVLN
jgi:hypothetical protein